MKKVLITGATSGIGLETARLLGKNGYHICLNGISQELGQETIASLKKENISCDFYLADITNETEVNKMLAEIEKKHNSLDGLINNAGGLVDRNRIEGMTTEFYRKVIGLNLDSVFFVTRASLPLLK